MLFTNKVERKSHDPLTDIFKAASDPTRRFILTLLAQHGPLRDIDSWFEELLSIWVLRLDALDDLLNTETSK
ncbi:hypothetical protein PEL8287_02724 [Roseovarius litorisediminis]|uniref:HTH arsR-type domain-containing protein n=1 Tax=Roseovarius litorisediminis TaxID=1312363 RepID=A0A1Y5SYT2_9RHOB|nr:helix-turn-helix transcriptional regulator [Roseovarius litorisediminis]SLN52072.1 hypothetical protein PEL8287_02724 [Roseovarius litorisediminis]